MAKIYLDYAAATPMSKEVVSAMQPYFSQDFYNPSAIYLDAKNVRSDIESARQSVAALLGAKPTEIIFVAGGTESCNLAIKGVMDNFPGKNLVISAIEHEAVFEPAKSYKHQVVSVNKQGVVDLDNLINLINDETVLVSVMYANNEIGTIQPLREISQLLTKIKSERLKQGNKLPLYLHTDACQVAAYLDLHVSRLGVDLMTLNGGKIYGPKQSGILYVNRAVGLKPQIVGGGQESGLRSGTENVASIIGFSRALELVQKAKTTEVRRLNDLRDLFVDELSRNLKISINGSLTKRLPNNLSVTFEGVDSERLLMQLDEAGIICASGAACSANDSSISRTLLAIGLDENSVKSTLRFSMGQQTTDAEVKKTASTIKKLIS